MPDLDEPPEPMPVSVPWRYLILRYLVVMVLTIVALRVIYALLEAFLAFEGASSSGVVAVIVPALDAGQAFARRMKRVPSTQEAWRLTVVFFVLNALMGMVLIGVVQAVSGGLGPPAELGLVFEQPFALGVLGVVLLAYLLATRFFLGWGAGNEVKRAAAQTPKDQ